MIIRAAGRSRPRARSLLVAGTVSLLAAAGVVTGTSVADAAPAPAADCANGYVALTFDDGPNPGNTNTLLNALRQAGVRATMFNTGQNAAANPGLVSAQRSAGMWIGNHSYTHPHMLNLSSAQMSSELSRTQTAIQNGGGGTPVLFRPPYGETNGTLQAAASALGLRTITWDVDSQDWNGASTAQIVQAASRLTNGQSILMHDQYATTVAAIPQIVSGLRNRGLCAGMISPSTGRAVAPDGTSTPPPGGPTTPPPAGGSCTATLSAGQQFGDRFNLNVAVSGTSSWTVTLNLNGGQSVQSSWNASVSGTTGSVTARPNGSGNTFGITIMANGNWNWPTASCRAG
jgi:peptidoglycan/xylan/chitin deacetylase (PgdA/CDA1 family)